MTSEELAYKVTKIIDEAASRIVGTGKEQYSIEDRQKFEYMTPLELLDEAQDEILDLINYSIMTYIRIEQIKEIVT